MQFSLYTTFKNGRQDVQRLTATDRTDARDHCVEVVQTNRNVRRIEVSDLTFGAKPFFSAVSSDEIKATV